MLYKIFSFVKDNKDLELEQKLLYSPFTREDTKLIQEITMK